MNYLILSSIGLSFFLVSRLSESSLVKTVYFCCLDTDMKDLGKDMEQLSKWSKLKLITDYNEVLNVISKDDLIIIIDDTGLGETGKNLRDRGYKVIGGSPDADKIEEDRDYAQQIVKGIMDVPETYSFDTFAAGIAFAKTRQKDESFYFKPNDSSVPKDYTYHGKDIPDIIEAMKNFKEEWKWKESFQLQKEVKGQLMDFSVFFNSKGDMLPNSLIYYFENKPVGNDDIGVQTGGACAVEYSHKLEGQFYEIFQKLKPRILKDGYVGQIAVNCIIDETTKKPVFLEFCGRLGYPSLALDLTLIEDAGKTAHDLFFALATGQVPNLFPLNKIAVTIWIGIPPYPYKDGVEKNAGVPISWDSKWDSYFFPYYVKYDKRKQMVAAGLAGEIVQVTCVDSTLAGAVDMLYNQYMPTLKLKNMFYRTDCGKDPKKRIAKLHEWKII